MTYHLSTQCVISTRVFGLHDQGKSWGLILSFLFPTDSADEIDVDQQSCGGGRLRKRNKHLKEWVGLCAFWSIFVISIYSASWLPPDEGKAKIRQAKMPVMFLKNACFLGSHSYSCLASELSGPFLFLKYIFHPDYLSGAVSGREGATVLLEEASPFLER